MSVESLVGCYWEVSLKTTKEEHFKGVRPQNERCGRIQILVTKGADGFLEWASSSVEGR